MRILAVNSGSSSLKLKSYLYRDNQALPEQACTVQLEGEPGAIIRDELAHLERPDVIVHRVVFGGAHVAPARLDVALCDELAGYRRFAPRHTDVAMAAVEAAASFEVPMVAVFDSAFHATMPEVAKRYAIPKTSVGQYRRGFHGFAHASLVEQYAAATGHAEPSVVTVQLGSGASACAVLRGRSVDTSMGMSPLEGLMMATRSGDIDPALVLELVESGSSTAEVRDILSEQSGLRALAGDKDMRALLARRDAGARLAVESYCYRAAKYVGAYLAALRGAEAIVMGGGVAEGSPQIRAAILERFAWAGLELDAEQNLAGGPRLTREGARLAAYVFRPDEEAVMVRMALPLIQSLEPS